MQILQNHNDHIDINQTCSRVAFMRGFCRNIKCDRPCTIITSILSINLQPARFALLRWTRFAASRARTGDRAHALLIEREIKHLWNDQVSLEFGPIVHDLSAFCISAAHFCDPYLIGRPATRLELACTVRYGTKGPC